MQIVYGVVTVSEKGQIAIPVNLRRDLGISQGDRLMVLKRKDKAGLSLIKLDKIDELMYSIQEDDQYFSNFANEEGEKMATCKECKFFQPIDEAEGSCFGHKVEAERPVEECQAKAFKPKDE